VRPTYGEINQVVGATVEHGFHRVEREAFGHLGSKAGGMGNTVRLSTVSPIGLDEARNVATNLMGGGAPIELRLNFVVDRRPRQAMRRSCLVIAGDQFAKKAPQDAGRFLFQRPRSRADGVSVDPLGSSAIGPSVFPEMFAGLVAIRPIWPTMTPVGEPGNSVLGRFIGASVPGRACAKANVAGSVKASASVIVVSLMGFSLRLHKRKRGKPGVIVQLNSS
jgi:hypothetical protein